MRSPTPLIVLASALLVCACGNEKAAPPSPGRGAAAPVASAPEGPRAGEDERPTREAVPGKEFGYQSPYSNPESLLKPVDGFPLPASARLESQGRDLMVYEVQLDLAAVETFYEERGFRITRPGKLPGLIVTRTDTGTRLQVKPGKHRGTILRFFR